MPVLYTVNEEQRTSTTPLSIADIVHHETSSSGATAAATADAQGIAVALNRTVVPRSQWESQQVSDGDDIDLLVAVQGG
ncbi:MULTISPECIES: sulfur carrier protein ThiS [Auritidibacter]|uniref:Sulfur carrier protein ThiS n=1 Tax=Auritidibacter ignavus TaxID=678932 RepID=A0AAJ6AJ11_9MICC|nr:MULTISPECIES: sulfur carrier protein ThiS [Auritidibacter]NIH72190.1 sulfur carrier protein [Auritidibacter ignavus]WGH84756.1 sulfur carrier protein ThiS [Auritidibacter ignavus]WGH87115.1 sulfur carrier protein ThiS [Auritidibacter ignavus]WGH89399.1 sulfur carrier protein ThiS [Auritidibacter ignavus]WGH91742.1 sulfur carrier protein ThiS [Auritidibacter ignavus]